MEINICPKCEKEKLLGVTNLFGGSTMITSYCTDSNCSCEKTKVDIKEQDFVIFIKCLSVAYKEFCMNQRMHEKIKTGPYHRFEQQWDVVLVSLEVSYMLWLAKFLDNSDAPDCLKGFAKQGMIAGTDVWKIKNWRKDFLAHFNALNLREWTRFLGANHLNNESVKALFSKIIEIAEEYNDKTKYLPTLRESFNQLKKDTLVECDKWLDNFKDGA